MELLAIHLMYQKITLEAQDFILLSGILKNYKLSNKLLY